MILKNKTVNFLGDSITEGVGVYDRERSRYDNIILKKCGLKKVNNYGHSGTRIAHQYKPTLENISFDMNFCGRAYRLDEKADIIIAYGGVNDYIHGDAPFGTMDDTTNETFCGGVDFLMNFLKTGYPHAKVIFLTPARCFECEKVSNDALKPPNSKSLKYYVDVIVNKGKKYDIPVLNLYTQLPINPNIEEDKEKYTTDGLHLNDLGHGVLADTVIRFLEEL